MSLFISKMDCFKWEILDIIYLLNNKIYQIASHSVLGKENWEQDTFAQQCEALHHWDPDSLSGRGTECKVVW